MSISLHSDRYGRLCQLLIEYRRAAELTQIEVAEALSKPQSYVSKYENGERRLDLIELIDIAAVLGVTPSDFIDQLAKA